MGREPLVLLPGMMCDERLFAPQIEAFGDRFEILVPRLAEPSIEAMAASILAQAPAGPLNVAGLSMGGIVAMAMVANAPQRVGRLALLDTNHRADAPERRAIRDRQIADVRAGRLREVIVDEMKPTYLALRNQGNRQLLDLLVEMALAAGEDAFVAQSLALRDRSDHTSALAGFAGPALVLCGEEDRLCPVERHREIAALLSEVELAIIAGAGHISTLENPAAVNEALELWLARPLA